MKEKRWDSIDHEMKNIMWSDLPPAIQLDLRVIQNALHNNRMEWSEVPEPLWNKRQGFAIHLLRTNKKPKIMWCSLPSSVQSDPDVVRMALWKKRMAWLEAPEPLRNDPDFVERALVGGLAIDWNHLSVEMKSDPKVATIIMSGKIWDSVRKKTKEIMWRELPGSVQSNYDVANAALKFKRLEWAELPDTVVQNDLRIARHGLIRGYITTADDCACLRNARQVLQELVEKGRVKWQQLPTVLRNDIAFARSIHFKELKTVQDVFEHIPQLQQEQRFWQGILADQLESRLRLSKFLCESAPAAIRSNPIVMGLAVQQDGNCLAYVDPLLKSRRNFIEPLLNEKPWLLHDLSKENMQSYPGVVQAALGQYATWFKRNYGSRGVVHVVAFAEKIPSEFWQDSSFILEWFTAGLPFVAKDRAGRELIPVKWQNNKEIFLLMAKEAGQYHTLGKFCHESFQSASPELLSDKKFMLQVVKHDPSLLDFAPVHLQQDFDVALLACSGKRSLVERYFDSTRTAYNGRDQFVQQFLANIKEMPKMRRIFRKTVLPLINSSQSGQASTLSALNQGAETCEGYVNLLEEFLVPSAEQVTMIRHARKTLTSILD